MFSSECLTLDSHSFSSTLLKWFDNYGRKHLPWQKNPTPYRVWISEIMLQQTQVKTVIPYFERFMETFPTIEKLAKAKEDQVLHLWSGLGYYARARNLHKAAKIITQKYDKQFPNQLEEIMKLPGIGRSTAGAILSISMNKPTPILDGNVKRVLTRLHAISGWPGERNVEEQLWQLATNYTPKKRNPHYTQAIMDLGATICTRTHPKCIMCPFQKYCQAHQQHLETEFPTKKSRKPLPIRTTLLLLIQNQKREVLLEKRPPLGIWGGLWCFPQCQSEREMKSWCELKLQSQPHQIKRWESFRHTFTHFHLDITPLLLTFKKLPIEAMEPEQAIWYNTNQPSELGLAAPVKKLLEALQ